MLNLSKKDKKMLTLGLILAMVFVVVGVMIFSYAQETLDVKAEELGAQESTVYNAPFPDYVIQGFEGELGNILLGILSMLAIFGVTLGVAMMLKKSKRTK
jgi:hypothetical protein